MSKNNIWNILCDVPKEYKKSIDYVVDCIKRDLKNNVLAITLGGSCGKNIPIAGWSDIDIYVILKKYNFNEITKLNDELKNCDIHIGLTFYTETEIKKGFIDSRTKVMLYEKQTLNMNPNLYGEIETELIDYNVIKNNDKNNMPGVLHEVRRMHTKVLNDGEIVGRKYIKKVILLLKCYFNVKGKFLYGYTMVVKEFLNDYNKKENKSTNTYFFDIISALRNITKYKIQIIDFVNRVLNYIDKEIERY
ncbi:MAG: hypothetical protein MR779_02910 [Tenericutes bacterium]|nr:hypothetical protein [Mycoplasmatota bacterium]